MNSELLMQAVNSDDVKTVREMLENELVRIQAEPRDFELQDELVCKALISKNEEMIKVILKFVDDLDEKFEILHNLTYYLKLGIVTMDLELTEFMLKNGVRLPETDTEWPNVILDRIYINKRKDMLKLLVKYDLNANIHVGNDRNLLHLLAHRFVRKSDPDAVEIAEILINAGVPVDAADKDGYTPLLYSVERKNIQLVRYLIEKGADIHHKHMYGGSALHLAASSNDNIEIVDLLLSLGADVNDRDMAGGVPLNSACSSNQGKMITFLIQKGAQISNENLFKYTPLGLVRPQEDYYHEALIAMMKEFSKLRFDNQSIFKSDMKRIQENPDAKKYFDGCIGELNRMKNDKFHGFFSYYSLLTTPEVAKILTLLTKDEDFVKRFEEYLCSLYYFHSDLKEILDKAIKNNN